MASTAFLLDVIVFGLIAAVVVPVIDLILYSMRSGHEPGYTSFDFGFDRERIGLADTRPTSRRPAELRGKADVRSAVAATASPGPKKGGGTKSGRSRTRPEFVCIPAGVQETGGALRRPLPAAAPRFDFPIAEERGQVRRSARFGTSAAAGLVEAPAGYVASNGIIVTPNMGIFREMAPAASAGAGAAGAPADAVADCARAQLAAGQAAAASIAAVAARDKAHAAIAQPVAPRDEAHAAMAQPVAPADLAISDPVHSVRVPAGHPHSEYWRYGSAHFYDAI